ncbi:MAG: response regulator [Bacteroidota bacterium]|nr:response regulator [Bacteroidota bacterium]MDP4231437.1 response regulator [Bacteroidota bacterium]MDP4235906.1 response regulator [Bacteroidota bacterium]
MSEARILIVDDREDNLLSIEAILSSENYRIVKANSGRQALKVLLNDQNFNLILMDIKMPGLSGFETASLIYEREKLKNIPIIFITAHVYNDEIIYEGFKTGAVDYIYKPIKPELLKAKVAVFIDLYKKTEALMMQEIRLKAINKNLQSEIKERQQSEQQVQKLNQELVANIHTLENANADLARFAYVASHDLQEPLRKIQMFGDLLKTKYQTSIDETGQYYIDRMQKGSQRLQTLIKDILTYSRLTGSSAFFSNTNLNTIISEILADFELKIKELGATFIVSDLPELYINPVQIRQLFQNIISNALKFSRKHVQPEIRITYDIGNPEAEEILDDNQYCNISIQDNGIGFDESYLEQIFTLFKRLNDNSVYEGTGIGLAICKKIVEQHKGFIRATSKIDQGSTFIISLPFHHPHSSARITTTTNSSENGHAVISASASLVEEKIAAQ